MMPASHSSNALQMSAVMRITRSRIALRLALREGQANSNSTSPPSIASVEGWDLLKNNASAYLLLQGLQKIWANHPWRIVGQNAIQVADLLVKPIAEHSPVKLVTGAFVVGGLLFLARPWRLMTKSALIAGILAR